MAPDSETHPRQNIAGWQVALWFLFGLYVLLSVLERYNSTDYCNMRYAQTYGALMGRWLYDRWTGTIFLGTTLGFFTQFQTGPTGIFTAAALVLWLIALRAVIRQLAFEPVRQNATLLSLLFVVAVLDAAPGIGQDFYWVSALFEYGLSLLLFTVTIWWIIHPAHASPLIGWLGALVTAWLTALCSVMSAALLPTLCVVLLLIGWRWPQLAVYRLKLFAALIGATSGAVVIAIAPGTSIRAATFPPRDLLTSLWLAGSRAVLPIWDAVTRSPAGAVALFTVIVFVGGLISTEWRSGAPKMAHRRAAITVAAVMVISSALTVFVFYFSTSSLDPAVFGRVELLAVFVAVLGFGWLAVLLPRPHGLNRPLVKRLVIGVFVAASLLRIGTLGTTMAVYAQQWDIRNAAIRSGQTTIAPLHIFDLVDIETSWALDCVRQYYGAAVDIARTTP